MLFRQREILLQFVGLRVVAPNGKVALPAQGYGTELYGRRSDESCNFKPLDIRGAVNDVRRHVTCTSPPTSPPPRKSLRVTVLTAPSYRHILITHPKSEDVKVLGLPMVLPW